MKKRGTALNKHRPSFIRASILLLIIITLSITLLLMMPGKVVAFGTHQLTATSIQGASLRIVASPSPTVTNTTSASTSEADRVTSLAEFVIYWAGIGLAVVTALLAVAGLIGFIEIRSIRRTRSDLIVLRNQFVKENQESQQASTLRPK